MNQLFIEETREQQPEQVHGDVRDGMFGRKVLSIHMIDAAHTRIRSHQALGQLGHSRMHGQSIRQLLAERKRLASISPLRASCVASGKDIKKGTPRGSVSLAPSFVPV